MKFSFLITILYYSLTTNISLADESKWFLDLQIRNSEIFYGKSIDVDLTVDKKFISHMTDLLKPFNASLDYTIVNKFESGRNIIYKLRVYPLKPGLLIIPALKWNKSVTSQYIVKVKPSVARNNEPVKVVLDKPNSNPWVRQQTKITATIITVDRNIILDRKNIQNKGIESYLLPQKTEVIKYNNTEVYKHTIGWNVFFLYDQFSELQLPEIEYVKDGVPLYKYHFETQRFTVKKLPIYVSPVIPVGKLDLKLRYLELPLLFMQPNTTSIIQYSLTGTGVPAKWLPSLAQQYNLISQSDILYSHVKTTMKTQITDTTLVGNKTIDIAFTPVTSGMAHFNKLDILYFDPDSGMLEKVNYKYESLIILNWFLQLVFIVLLLHITYRIIIRIVKFIRRRIYSYTRMSECKSALELSTQSGEIKAALMLFSNAHFWKDNLTINQWLAMFESIYIASDNLIDALYMLNQDLYANNTDDNCRFEKMKLMILKEFGTLKKKPLDIKKLFNVIYSYQNAR